MACELRIREGHTVLFRVDARSEDPVLAIEEGRQIVDRLIAVEPIETKRRALRNVEIEAHILYPPPMEVAHDLEG